MDVVDISPGQNFTQAIEQTIASCGAVLVIIGPRWMEILRKRSSEDQPDYVCREIEEALKRKATVIPVLVGRANMDQLTGLPDSLADLPLHEATELRDETFKDDCARLAKALGAYSGLGARFKINRTRKALLLWMCSAVLLIALLLAVLRLVGIGPFGEYQVQKTRVHQLLDTAQTQINQAEYESAFETYGEVLKIDPVNRTALDRQVDAAMLWLQNFHVLVGEGQKLEDLAAPLLSEIMPVLDAGLARTGGRGERAADILAHLGWAHWLNERFAEKEFGPAAEQDLNRALKLDPANVYANAMLGNWLLQNNGSFSEALHHFEVALKTNQQRPFVRLMQLGGLISSRNPRARRQLTRVANEMRMNSEPMDEEYKRRLLSNYASINTHDELTETLSAVPPDEAWATFLWLDDSQRTGNEVEQQRIQRQFIQANILEIAGKSGDALARFRTLQPELKREGYDGSRLAEEVDLAIKRLSQSR